MSFFESSAVYQPPETYSQPAAILDSIIGTHGKGEKLIKQWGSLQTVIQNLNTVDITPRQRTAIRAALSLHYGMTEERPIINSPADAAALIQHIESEPQEHLVALLLDRRNRVMKTHHIYKGSVNSSQVRIGEVFREAIPVNASALILAHNHPSGDPTPSPDDVAVTRAIVQAGKLLDIEVLDHLIIGLGKWVSLKERGLGFS